MEAKLPRIHWVLCVLLLLGNASLQLYLHRDALDNGVENKAGPSSTDTRDYVRRAELLAVHPGAGGFQAAFADGHRTPGYPVFLAAFHPLFKAPLRAARIAQILLSAAIILLAFFTLLNILGPGIRVLWGTALVAVWPPLYHFSPFLIAETCSLFVLAALLWTLSLRPGSAPRLLLRAAPPLLFAVLALLKPNHFLLLLPVAAFLWVRDSGEKKNGSAPGIVSALTFTLLSLALLAPWSAFVSLQSGKPVLLSTASGMNLYRGTGIMQDPKDANTLPYRFAENWANDPGEADLSAGAIWRQHPVRTAVYGLTKTLHGFGFSLRGLRDVLLVALLAASVFCSWRMWRRGVRGEAGRDDRAWALFFGAIVLVTVFQLFVYLPNQRLKTVLFDLPALVIIVLGLRTGSTRRHPGTSP